MSYVPNLFGLLGSSVATYVGDIAELCPLPPRQQQPCLFRPYFMLAVWARAGHDHCSPNSRISYTIISISSSTFPMLPFSQL